ncbi:polysaccharide deacetylase family protein [bacterium]|nr:polysaccharide deacetylase family protein [bacterium]
MPNALSGNSRLFAAAVVWLLIFAASASGAERILLVYPEATDRFYHAGSTERESLAGPHGTAPDSITTEFTFPDSGSGFYYQLKYWRDLFEDLGYTVSVSRENGLLMTDAYSFIVLPGALCLSDDHVNSLRRFVDRGGGLLLTGPTGTRNLDGSQRGYAFLEWALGAIPAQIKGKSGEAIALQMRWGVPGTHRLPPGYYLRATLYADPLYIPPSDNIEIGGYWATPGYKDVFSHQIERRAGFVVRDWEAGGRVAWFGDNLGGLHGDPANMQHARLLFEELGTWLTGEALVSTTWWPKRRETAVLIHGDIEDKFGFVSSAVELIDKFGFPATFNLLVNEARKHPAIIRDMVEAGGELAIHGDNHDRYAGQPLDKQIERLQRASEFIEAMDKRPRGFRPPELAFDRTTVEALKQLGFEYITADSIADRAAPRFVPFDPGDPEGEGIVFFPKNELDDYDLFSRYQLKMPSTMTEAMIGDFERIHDMGGLYKWNYHSQYLDGDELIVAKEALFRHLDKQKNLWFATALQLAEWTLDRYHLDTSSERVDKGILVRVKNRSEQPVEDVVLKVLPRKGVHVEQIAPLELTGRAVSDARKDGFYLTLPKLKAGETFEVLFGEEGSGYISARQPSKYLKWGGIGLLILGGAFLIWNIYYFLFAKRQYKVSEHSVKFDPSGRNVPSAQSDHVEAKAAEVSSTASLSTPEQNDDASPGKQEPQRPATATPATNLSLMNDAGEENSPPFARAADRHGEAHPENRSQAGNTTEEQGSILHGATAPPPPGVSKQMTGLAPGEREPISGGGMAGRSPVPPPQPGESPELSAEGSIDDPSMEAHTDHTTGMESIRDYRSERLRDLEETRPQLRRQDYFSGHDALSGKQDRGFSGAVRSAGYRYSSPDREGFSGATYSTRRREQPSHQPEAPPRHHIPDPGLPVSRRIQQTRQMEEEAEREAEGARNAEAEALKKEEELRRRENELQRREEEIRRRELERSSPTNRRPLAPPDPDRQTLRDLHRTGEVSSFSSPDSLLPRSTAPLPGRRYDTDSSPSLPEDQPKRHSFYSVQKEEEEDNESRWN